LSQNEAGVVRTKPPVRLVSEQGRRGRGCLGTRQGLYQNEETGEGCLRTRQEGEGLSQNETKWEGYSKRNSQIYSSHV